MFCSALLTDTKSGIGGPARNSPPHLPGRFGRFGRIDRVIRIGRVGRVGRVGTAELNGALLHSPAFDASRLILMNDE